MSRSDHSVTPTTTEDDSIVALMREVAAAPSVEPSKPPKRRQLQPGEVVAERFEIRRLIGSGGMGSVYAAFDRELDREIALKLARLRGGDVERTMREARAMARLSHPNVVAVHDVGRFDEHHIYIVMELVPGMNARHWISASPRKFIERFELYLDAGEGLVAAHAEGIVHRDFKPDNVLVDDRGRVKIADFGLARRPIEDGRPHESMQGPVLESLESETPSSDETPTGAVIGTPAYMAPEQALGEPVDARADQFAFATSMWEAVYGRRPWRGERPANLRSDVPRWVEPILQRALEARPEDRFPDMSTLLEALRLPGRRKRQRRLGAGVLAATCIAAAGGYLSVQTRSHAACDQGAALVDTLWTDEDAQALASRFKRLDDHYGPGASDAVTATLWQWMGDWRRSYREACLAVESQEDASATMAQRRLECLEGQRLTLEQGLALLEGLEEGGDPINAYMATTHALPQARDCESAAYLASLPSNLANEHPDAKLSQMTDELFQLNAYALVGDNRKGLALAESLVERSNAPEYASVHANALYLKGTFEMYSGRLEEAEATATEAYFAARRNDDEYGAASTAARLVWVVGVGQGRLSDGELWARHAAAAIANRPVPLELRAQIDSAIGVLAEEQHDPERALKHYRRALELRTELYGPEHVAIANGLNDIGAALDALGRREEALATYTEALRIRGVSPARPDSLVTMLLSNRGLVHTALGNHEAAVEDQRAALANQEALVDPDSPELVVTLLNLGIALIGAKRPAEGMPFIERARELAIDGYGPEHPDVGYCAAALAEALILLEREDDARAAYEQAKAVAEVTEGYDISELAALIEHFEGSGGPPAKQAVAIADPS